MVAFESSLVARKIGMVFACFAAAHAVVIQGQSWQPALGLTAGYLLTSILFCRAKSIIALFGFSLMLGICTGFTLLHEFYGSILYHVLLLTVALEFGIEATKQAAVAILLVYLGATIYAADIFDKSLVSGIVFNIIGFYTLAYTAVHLHMLMDKKQSDESRMKALIDQNNQHYRMALTDGLTGLYNRRAYNEKIDSIRDYAILVIDIDHFKHLNDTYGHAMGDKVLVKLGNIIKLSIRQGDAAFRYGGEEFVIVLPGASLSLGCTIAERLRQKVCQTDFAFGVSRIGVTVSIGVALRSPGISSAEAFERADDALYRAKQQGRNQVQRHGGSARPETSYYQVN